MSRPNFNSRHCSNENVPSLVRIFEQIPEPKYVITMGACTITGGYLIPIPVVLFDGVDKLIPMDIYLSGYSPKPKAVINAITKPCKKISHKIYEVRIIKSR